MCNVIALSVTLLQNTHIDTYTGMCTFKLILTLQNTLNLQLSAPRSKLWLTCFFRPFYAFFLTISDLSNHFARSARYTNTILPFFPLPFTCIIFGINSINILQLWNIQDAFCVQVQCNTVPLDPELLRRAGWVGPGWHLHWPAVS